MTITRWGLVENQQLVIACDYRERVVNRTLVRFVVRRYLVKLLMY